MRLLPACPMPDSPLDATFDLRRSLGRFATGVTVVTCRDARGRPCGITVNSFSSVSLEPPLVLWNIAKVSNSLEAFLNADRFAVNVLAEHQHELAAHFARSDHRLFDGIDHGGNTDGAPELPDTIATFDCARRDVHDAGDHFIILGEVLRHDAREGEPLLFYRGGYASIARG